MAGGGGGGRDIGGESPCPCVWPCDSYQGQQSGREGLSGDCGNDIPQGPSASGNETILRPKAISPASSLYPFLALWMFKDPGVSLRDTVPPYMPSIAWNVLDITVTRVHLYRAQRVQSWGKRQGRAPLCITQMLEMLMDGSKGFGPSGLSSCGLRTSPGLQNRVVTSEGEGTCPAYG